MKKISLGIVMTLLVVMLAGCISIPIGNGNSIKLSKDGFEVKNKEGETTKINVDEDEGSFSMTGTDKDGNEMEYSQKSGQEIPEDFPKDIPIPGDATITGGVSTKVDGSHGMNVAYIVEGDDDVSKYLKMYVDYAEGAGYDAVSESNYGDGGQFSASRDEIETISLMVARSDEGIEVLLSYTIHSEEE